MDKFTKHPWSCDFSTHTEQSPLVGILIENRDHPYLEATLRNFSCMLPYAALWVIHSRKNAETIKRVVGPTVRTECILPDDNFTVRECDAMKMTPEFWKKFRQFQRVLIFNVDTGIKYNILLRFMHFDYIGAMWYHNPLHNDAIFQGNGGFSLRNPRLMEEITSKWPQDARPPEDLYFTWKIWEHYPGACMPKKWECELFSTETLEVPRTFGFHDVERYFPQSRGVYVGIDGPVQKLVEVQSAFIDGFINVTPLVKLGIGPNCLRIPRETNFGPGKTLSVDDKTYRLENGHPEHDIVIWPKSEFHVYYRLSDHNNGNVEKDRPRGFCKRKNLENFLKVFSGVKIHVIADRVSDDTAAWLKEQVDDVEFTQIGNGGDTTCHAIRRAIHELSHTDIVYLVEDDYLHRTGSVKIIEEGLDIADYVSLYDHPDKYVSNGPNPFVFHGGETCLVQRTKNVHWKRTNSTTLTFATRVGTLAYDKELHFAWCGQGKSLDFNLFIDLGQRQGRTLATPIPGYSTHLQPPWVDTFFESYFSDSHT